MASSPCCGATVRITRSISIEDVERFAELSRDRNPVHFDEEVARRLLYRGRVAHGLLGVALISGGLTQLMGDGNVWLTSSIKFERPIYIGDELTATLVVVEVSRRNVATIDVSVANQSGEQLISGQVQSVRVGR